MAAMIRRGGHPPPPARRVFMCTECHKPFRTREELYLHAEMCLLEAFETEAANMLTDMPDLRKTDAAAAAASSTTNTGIATSVSGITAKPSDRPELPPQLQVERPLPSGMTLGMRAAKRSDDQSFAPGPSKVRRIEGDFQEIRKPMVYNTNAPLGNVRTIEGARGLKLVVSVEKPDEYSNEQSDDQFDDLDLDELDEDVSVPTGGFTGGESSGGGGGGFGLGKVVGALANADDDPYKPKMECPTCGLVLYRHNFSTHYRIHTGEMPFQCSYCEKRFRTTSALKVHTRAHTGEKPYVCPKCNYACITKRNLDRHIINNHVREGHRRGPRYRRSRYRDVDPHHEEYLMELAGQHDDLDDEDGDEDIDDEATYVIMEGGMDEVEDGSDPSAQVHKGEHGADDGSEEVLDPHTSTVVHG